MMMRTRLKAAETGQRADEPQQVVRMARLVHQAVVLAEGPCRLAKVRRPTQVETGWAFTGSYYETYSREAVQSVREAQRVARMLGGPEGNLRLQPNWMEIISNIEDKSDKFDRGKKNCCIGALNFLSTSFYLRTCLAPWRLQAEDCIYGRYAGYGREQPNHLDILPHYRLARGSGLSQCVSCLWSFGASRISFDSSSPPGRKNLQVRGLGGLELTPRAQKKQKVTAEL